MLVEPTDTNLLLAKIICPFGFELIAKLLALVVVQFSPSVEYLTLLPLTPPELTA